MSYRSDVTLVFSTSEELSRKTEEYELWVTGEGKDSILDTLKFVFSTMQEEEELVEFSSVNTRWYEFCDNPKIDRVVYYLRWLDSQRLDTSYQFIRLGDEITDIEERGALSYYEVHRVLKKF